MKTLLYINRETKQIEQEEIIGAFWLKLLYGNSWFHATFGKILQILFTRFSFFSHLYGSWQKLSFTRKKIVPFIKHHRINTNEFEKPVNEFSSFNDFFTRKLKPEARPLDPQDHVAIIPADGKYYFFDKLKNDQLFVIKGQEFSLTSLLSSNSLTEKYLGGSAAIGRLSPYDYHRFHFPSDCIPQKTHSISGSLFTVNPKINSHYPQVYVKNKRTWCQLQTPVFKDILFMEVGATFVGTIHQTYMPYLHYTKGQEKGFFSFGGSSLILLFEPNTIIFDSDLTEATHKRVEIFCKMGQSMGKSVSKNKT